MKFFVVFFVSIGFLMGLYFYKYLKRSFLCFGADLNKKSTKCVLVVSAIVLGIGCANIGSTGALFGLHIVFISLFMRFINLCLKLIFKTSYAKKFVHWQKIYKSGIVPVVLSAIILIAGYFNMHNIVKTEYTVFTHKEIKNDGYTIALVADVHFGVSINEAQLRKKCSEISSCNPDIVVLAGDITDSGTSKNQMEAVYKELGQIKSKYGIFYIYGNHDRSIHQMKNPYTDKELEETIQKNGIKILKDETFKINDEITLIGREDLMAEKMGDGRLSLKELTKNVPKSQYIINLDHQPNDYRENGNLGVDLVLSGHTHGGQIWPADLIQKIIGINDAVYGRTEITETTNAVVTSGFAGWSYPIKTSAPSEYAIIRICRG